MTTTSTTSGSSFFQGFDGAGRFFALIVLRSFFISLLVVILNEFFQLGTSPVLLAIGVCAGVVVGSFCARTRLTNLGFFLLGFGSAIAYRALVSVTQLFTFGGAWIFTPYSTELHINLFLLSGAVAAASTWAYWRSKHTVSLEAIFLAGGCIILLSGHRDYHFDLPTVVGTLAWFFRVEHLTVLVSLGIGTLILTLTYLYLSVLPGRPSADPKSPLERLHREPPSYRDAVLFLCVVLGLFAFVSRELYWYYHQISLTRTANGVGQEKKEGLSPLGFHSALGSNNQPAGLVRLEGDYTENPYSPMLYLREDALSEFNGRELVVAPKFVDGDVTKSGPDELFNGDQDPALNKRRALIQSIYLLTEHKVSFAVDYPIAIRPLKNPNPGRFKGAYRAYSEAPAFGLAELDDLPVGDSRWNSDIRARYLATHPDPRYKELADKITESAPTPILKARAITQYLSKTSIYTLTPNHDDQEAKDPVAPYLFGDHRGYCVHFAHAMVYMFRALGIPSRIGTGYLTDLSQSKDGHILLRMSDRHAWAEIYVEGRGWIVFDIQPEQVESHAGSDVDMGLLEELMGILGPGEEILPEETLKGESNVKPPDPLVTKGRASTVFVFLILSILAAKLYIRYSWILPGTPARKLLRSYRSILSHLADVGIHRRMAETRSEFRTRIRAIYSLETLSLSDPLLEHAYSRGRDAQTLKDEIAARFARDLSPFSQRSWWKRLISFLNPSSLAYLVMWRRW